MLDHGMWCEPQRIIGSPFAEGTSSSVHARCGCSRSVVAPSGTAVTYGEPWPFGNIDRRSKSPYQQQVTSDNHIRRSVEGIVGQKAINGCVGRPKLDHNFGCRCADIRVQRDLLLLLLEIGMIKI